MKPGRPDWLASVRSRPPPAGTDVASIASPITYLLRSRSRLMVEHTPANTSPSKTAAKAAETHQRFQRLRELIGDERRRQRLLFVFSLMSLAVVSLMAFLA